MTKGRSATQAVSRLKTFKRSIDAVIMPNTSDKSAFEWMVGLLSVAAYCYLF